MSRGLGKWQRAIIETLKSKKAFYVKDLLPLQHTRSEYVALLRAVTSLEIKRAINVNRYMCWGDGDGKVVINRPGISTPRREVERLNVDKVPSSYFVNTYEGEITANSSATVN